MRRRASGRRPPGPHPLFFLLPAHSAAAAVLSEAWEPATGERLLQAGGAPILKLHGSMPQVGRGAGWGRLWGVRWGRVPAVDAPQAA